MAIDKKKQNKLLITRFICFKLINSRKNKAMKKYKANSNAED